MEEERVTYIVASADDSSSSVDDKEDDLEDAGLAYPNAKWRAVSGTKHAGPIQHVIEADAKDTLHGRSIPERYHGKKPIYVKANIKKIHLDTGESTSKSKVLQAIILKRGKTEGQFRDDCGHIISRTLGGHMIDYNLFPQSRHLNSGWMNNYVLWRCIEMACEIWLKKIPITLQPRVEFEMLLMYGDITYPNRPKKFRYVINFFITRTRRRENENDYEEKIYNFCNVVVNLAKEALKNSKRDFDLRQKILSIIKAKDLIEEEFQDILEMAKELDEILKIVQPVSTPSYSYISSSPSYSSYGSYSSSYSSSSATPSTRKSSPPRQTTSRPTHVHRRNRDISVMDFVPIVGPTKGIVEGVEDLADGKIAKGIGNLALSGTSLALDVSTLGATSSVVRGGTKVVGQIMVRKAAGSAAKSAAVTATRKFFDKFF